MTLNLDDLERVAKAATPGAWLSRLVASRATLKSPRRTVFQEVVIEHGEAALALLRGAKEANAKLLTEATELADVLGDFSASLTAFSDAMRRIYPADGALGRHVETAPPNGLPHEGETE